ncbi:MAG: hypothetical protein KDK99_12580 [Verrucomicrobiales bacterium]|nr:hypothetical protein [Verrucomicrobiales bacterium]
MGQQLRSRIKRRRRKQYLARKKELAKAGLARSKKTAAKSSAEKAKPKAVKKATPKKKPEPEVTEAVETAEESSES